MKKTDPFGLVLCTMTAVLFATGGLLIKMVPWNPLAINGVRNLIGCCVIGIYLLVTHRKIKVNKFTLLGAACVFGVTTLFIYANKMTTAGAAIVLQYTAPVWVMVFSAGFLGKKLHKLEMVTMLAMLAGVLCFFFEDLGSGAVRGDLVALLAGVTYAGVFLLNEFPDGDALSSAFLGQAAAGILLTPFVRLETDFSRTPVLAILALGVFQVGLAYILLHAGTKRVSGVTASLATGIEPILNPVLVAVFWGERLGTLALLGAAIVILSVGAYDVLSARRETAA